MGYNFKVFLVKGRLKGRNNQYAKKVKYKKNGNRKVTH